MRSLLYPVFSSYLPLCVFLTNKHVHKCFKNQIMIASNKNTSYNLQFSRPN